MIRRLGLFLVSLFTLLTASLVGPLGSAAHAETIGDAPSCAGYTLRATKPIGHHRGKVQVFSRYSVTAVNSALIWHTYAYCETVTLTRKGRHQGGVDVTFATKDGAGQTQASGTDSCQKKHCSEAGGEVSSQSAGGLIATYRLKAVYHPYHGHKKVLRFALTN